MPLRELQFIITAPGAATSTTSQQKVARSHAARSAHARARRFQTSQYQIQKKREWLNDIKRRLNNPTDIAATLSASRKDPFTSFARLLKPMEQMLFDHCMLDLTPALLAGDNNPQRCNSYNPLDALQWIRNRLFSTHDKCMDTICVDGSNSARYIVSCVVSKFISELWSPQPSTTKTIFPAVGLPI